MKMIHIIFSYFFASLAQIYIDEHQRCGHHTRQTRALRHCARCLRSGGQHKNSSGKHHRIIIIMKLMQEIKSNTLGDGQLVFLFSS